MTGPRTAMFQRKGASPPSGAPTDPKDAQADDVPPGSSDQDPDMMTVTCPNCQCQFDPISGEVMAGPDDASMQSDQSAAAPPAGGDVDPSTMAMPEGMFS